MRLPIIPTITVVAAAITMVALGVWQLGRSNEKSEQIARYQSVAADSNVVVARDFASDSALYRPARLVCVDVSDIRTTAGRSAAGGAGWAYVARCTAAPNGAEPEIVEVTMGWSRQLIDVDWAGGEVTGRVAPAGDTAGRVVADPPLAGLSPVAAPDPADLPNNHLAYAGQWFFFALTALVIFVLAVWRKQSDRTTRATPGQL